MANMRKLLNNSSGLTLLETILSVAIIGLLILGVTTAISGFEARSDLDTAILGEVGALRRAEELSRGVAHDSNWGVKLATGTITIFKGSSFASRDSTFDETVEINPDIAILGAAEFIFFRLAATTTNIGTTTLFHTIIGESRTVNINEKGTISY